MNATTTLSPHQDTRGFVHNASALHTTPPAHPKATKRTFHLFRKADILTRQRQASAAVEATRFVASAEALEAVDARSPTAMDSFMSRACSAA